LVDAGVNMPSYIGQYAALQIFIFKKNSAPRVVFLLPRQVLSQGVWIAELIGRIGVERRVGIRAALFVSWQREMTFPDLHLSGTGSKAAGQRSGDQSCTRRNHFHGLHCWH